jgi:hypothetical protein
LTCVAVVCVLGFVLAATSMRVGQKPQTDHQLSVQIANSD